MIWVCDVGSNHNSSLDRALALIDTAAEVGCSHVKFQLFNSEISKKPEEWLPVEWLPKLQGRAHENKLQFGCSPFYLKAVEELEPFVDFYKLTSNYDMVKKLANKCLGTGKQLIFSFHADKIAPGYWHWQKAREDTKILVTVPNYPTAISDAHLEAITWGRFDGWSDHTRNPGVIYRVIHHYGAKVVEFHLDLHDGEGWEFKHGHCWLPSEIKEVIDNVREGFAAD